jgi:hypothetical protein
MGLNVTFVNTLPILFNFIYKSSVGQMYSYLFSVSTVNVRAFDQICCSIAEIKQSLTTLEAAERISVNLAASVQIERP